MTLKAHTIVHCATNHQFKMSLDVIIAWSDITLSICAQPRNQSQKRGFVAIVTLKTIKECCRVCNKSYFFLCLNLRQYDTFVALAIAFNLSRNKLPRPGPFSLGYSFRPALLA